MSESSPRTVVQELLEKDPFSQWMGVALEEVRVGYVRLRLQVIPDMLNGFSICHGGVFFALADTALAFAAKSTGCSAVAVEGNISFFRPLRAGALLYAEAQEIRSSQSLGVFGVRLYGEQQDVASFRGTVYYRRKEEQILAEPGPDDPIMV